MYYYCFFWCGASLCGEILNINLCAIRYQNLREESGQEITVNLFIFFISCMCDMPRNYHSNLYGNAIRSFFSKMFYTALSECKHSR
jgi:hypothetical protein